MTNLSYVFLRRLRTPLVLVIVVYAFCTFGLAVTPGVDEAGNVTPGMGLFHAFYVISYTGTTIGFGEVPVPFSGAQRIWMILTIYLTVSAWSYTVITTINLMREPAFQQITRSASFGRRIRGLREPFYIVCGVGETGTMVCHGLDRQRLRFVVVESDPQRFDEIQLEDFRHDPPLELGDASQPDLLTAAGLMSPHCRGVVAVTQNDLTNQSIAVNVRLLRPQLPVLARIHDPELDTQLGVFGGDLVINPFERFAEHLGSAVVSPRGFHLRRILTSLPGEPLPEVHRPPAGHWIMCGYGRFGHAVVEKLREAGLSVSVVDITHFDEGQVDVKARGTEVGSLEAAGISHANGIVVGNKEDQRNLAIAIRARELKPDIFVVTRQNQVSSRPLFRAFPEDFCMEPSRLVAEEFLAVITTPLLARFLKRMRRLGESGSTALADEIAAVCDGFTPEVWSITARPERTALHRWLAEGRPLQVGDLLRHPFQSDRQLAALPLMIARGRRVVLRPDPTTEIKPDDRVLFAGTGEAQRHQELVSINYNVLEQVVTGIERPGGWIFRALRSASGRQVPAGAPPTTGANEE